MHASREHNQLLSRPRSWARTGSRKTARLWPVLIFSLGIFQHKQEWMLWVCKKTERRRINIKAIWKKDSKKNEMAEIRSVRIAVDVLGYSDRVQTEDYMEEVQC